MSEDIEKIREEIERCFKCGLCMEFCPVYKEQRDESSLSRGKVALAEGFINNRLMISPELVDIIGLCLNCHTCSIECPGGTNTDKIVLALREYVARTRGIPLIKNIIFNSLPNDKAVSFLLKAISRYQKSGLSNTLKSSGIMRILELDKRESLIPDIPFRSALENLPEEVKVKNPKMRIAFFIGCATNYLYPEIAHSTVKVLKALNLNVIIPHEQRCCGTPCLNAGDREIFNKLKEHNAPLFMQEGIDAIIVSCSSCGKTLKNDYPQLKNKVYDISEFITDVTGIPEGLKKIEKKITYHDPCHLNRSQGITKQPREIITSIPNIEYIEMPDAGVCCGSAGTFSFTHYDIAVKITRRKVKNINATGAGIVLTGCPTCIMQLRHGLEISGSEIKVSHTIQLLANALPNV